MPGVYSFSFSNFFSRLFVIYTDIVSLIKNLKKLLKLILKKLCKTLLKCFLSEKNFFTYSTYISSLNFTFTKKKKKKKIRKKCLVLPCNFVILLSMPVLIATLFICNTTVYHF